MRTFKKQLMMVLAVLLIVFNSCRKKPIAIPSTVLSKAQIVPVLVDLHIAQAASVRQFSDSLRHNINDYTEVILSLHHISQAQYDSSLAFYTRNPSLMSEIYQEVINELSKKQSEVDRK